MWKSAIGGDSGFGHSFKACDDDSGMCNQFGNDSQDGHIAGLMGSEPGPRDTGALFKTRNDQPYFMVPIYVVTPPQGSTLFNRSLFLSRKEKKELATSVIRLLNWFSEKAAELKNTPSKDVTSLFETSYNQITFVFDYHEIELPKVPEIKLPRILASFSYDSKCFLHAANNDRSKSAFISSCKTNESAPAEVHSMHDLFMANCSPSAHPTKYFEAATEMPDKNKVRYFHDKITGVKDMTSSSCPSEEEILKGVFGDLNGGGEMFANYTNGAGGAVAHVPSYDFTYWFKDYFIVPQHDETDYFREYYKKTCCLPTTPADFRKKVDSVFLKPGTPKANTTLIFFQGDYYLEYDMSVVEDHPSAWLNFKVKHRPTDWPEAFVPIYRAYENHMHTFEFPPNVTDYSEDMVSKALAQTCIGGTKKCRNGSDIVDYLIDTVYPGYFKHTPPKMVSAPIFITTFPTNKAYLDNRTDIHVLQYHLGNLTSKSMARMVGALFLHDALNIPFEDYQCGCSVKYTPTTGHSNTEVENVNCKYGAKEKECGAKTQTDEPCIMRDFSTRGPFPEGKEFAFCDTTMKYINWLKP